MEVEVGGMTGMKDGKREYGTKRLSNSKRELFHISSPCHSFHIFFCNKRKQKKKNSDLRGKM